MLTIVLLASIAVLISADQTLRYTDTAKGSFKGTGAGDEAGETRYFNNQLTGKDDKNVGRSAGFCARTVSKDDLADVNNDPFYWHCQYTHMFDDGSSISFIGRQQGGPDNEGEVSINRIAVAGGTGKFAGATGEAIMTESDPVKFDFVVKLD